MEYSVYNLYSSFFGLFKRVRLGLVSFDFSDQVLRCRLNKLVAIYFTLHCLFTFSRLVVYFVFEEKLEVTHYACWFWLWCILLGDISFLSVSLQIEPMNEFLVAWSQVDKLILAVKNPTCSGWMTIKKGFRTQKRLFRLSMLFEAITIAIMLIITSANIFVLHDFPPYPHALVIRYYNQPVLVNATRLLQLYFSIVLLLVKDQMEIFSLGFARSLHFYLAVISSEQTPEPRTLPLKELKPFKGLYSVFGAENNNVLNPEMESDFGVRDAIHKYSEIEKLMKKFNGMFRWMVVLLKGLSVLIVAFSIIVWLRRRPSTPPTAMAVFYIVAASVFYRLGLGASAMGKAHDDSIEFLRCWTDRVTLSSRGNKSFNREAWLKLSTLKPLSFECGSFYVAKPNTILTYIYVIISYLIVALQIKD